MAEMTAEEAAEWGKSLDFPTVWTALLKLGERIDKTTENIDKVGERIDKTAENIDKVGERIDKLGEKVDRVTGNVGGLNQSMGDLVETLFAPHLGEKFDAYQYGLRRTFRRVPLYDDTNRLRGEIDILLSNTIICMAVEIKRWLDKTDQVDAHIKRMQLIRDYPPAEARGKTLLGAIAAAAVNPDVQQYAERSGFFVLELTGEDVRLLEPPEDFKPKEW
jgi:tetrahydromethanopterin S-methyltransferase subunit G